MRAALAATIVAATVAGAAAGITGAGIAIGNAADTPAAGAGGWTDASAQSTPSNFVSAALRRARRAAQAPAALPAGELATFISDQDVDGRPLSGLSSYVLRFAPDALPPTDAFWSLVALDAQGRFVDVSGALRSRNVDLRARGGALDIVVSASPPADPAATWLATPPGPFRLVLRAYAPAAALRDGRWRPPAVERRDTAA